MPRSAHLRHPLHRGYETTDKPPGDHRIHGQPALLSNGRLPDLLQSFFGSSLHVWSQRTHLHCSTRRSGTASGPVKSVVERRQFQNCESSELLFGVGVRAGLHKPLSFFDSYGCPGLRYLKRIPAYVDASFDKSLVVGTPRTCVCVNLRVLTAPKT